VASCRIPHLDTDFVGSYELGKRRVGGIHLGDKRLDNRAIHLVERLAERPTASIPGACTGWAEPQAAYRFLANDCYDGFDILEPHRECTLARMAEHPVVLCLQDTTELDFNGQEIKGARLAER
jgi:hypothetical protein